MTLEEVLAGADSFPTLPEVAERVAHKLKKGDWEVGAVARLIELDPSLSARILRMANSLLLGMATPSRSVREAIMRLGAQVTRDTVMTVSLMSVLPTLPRPLDVRSFWTLGLSSALMSRRVAGDLKLGDSEMAYLAGLVHCMGEAYLAVQHTRGFQRAAKRWQAEGGDLSNQLREEFGCGPREVCAGLLERWRFPEPVVEAVRWYGDPRSAPNHGDLAGVVSIADRLCRDLGMGLAPAGTPEEVWIEQAPAHLVERLAEHGYPDLTFYLLELQDQLVDIETVARQIFAG